VCDNESIGLNYSCVDNNCKNGIGNIKIQILCRIRFFVDIRPALVVITVNAAEPISKKKTVYFLNIMWFNTVRSESRCALIKGVGSDVHEP
jgi:hypothetical protein